MKGHKIKWSPDELAWIEANRQMVRPAAHKLFCQKFQRPDIALGAYAALCKRKGWLTGRDGRYDKGSVPANKGKKMPFNANSARTQFKKGHLGGRAKEIIKPIGAERTTKDGYIERKINNDMPLQSRWRAVHILNWEAIHGPLPEGHCLKCLDTDKSNVDPSNWGCISRALLGRLGGRSAVPYDSAPAELKPVILTLAKLKHAKSEAAAPKEKNMEAAE